MDALNNPHPQNRELKQIEYPFDFETVFVDEQGNINRREQHQVQCLSIELGNGVNLELVYIPGGSFIMGAPIEEERSLSNEYPQHLVTIKPFYMGKYPITQKQYEEITHHNPAQFKGENRPIDWVEWHDAKRFCAELSKKTGLAFELPSEAKWEYACRARTTTPFYFGATISAELANYHAETAYVSEVAGISRQETSDVGLFPPNAFGLYDLHGNVWEWCEDTRYGDYQGAPTDGSTWEQIGSGDKDDEICTIRGGSWQSTPDRCRSAASDDARYNVRSSDIGFRVILIPRKVTDTQPISTPIPQSQALFLIAKAAKEQWRTLDLSSQNLTQLPAEIGKLKHLNDLKLSNNQIVEISIAIGELKNLTSLNLSNNQIIEIPVAICESKNLTEINLSDNQITEIPATIGKLENLTRISLYKNVITEIPDSIGKLRNLKELNLRLNFIVDLPAEIGELRMLIHLDLYNN
ncbi:SUMF1/EgtB/PvdO family nonheme iron enzyme [Chamaesiphon sp. VAR_48_metabat_135_sub]|uniref:SUMF1/EgtB/PvdO family nonheme iron enzyme n=1 Tax=Chamaesiphon sp. VAR_48_metabat_135_sub TaxID=2964699 RepID=UPI00286B56CD|nr:SUMF1/EgtB/PvdO family nonheme iron enzyme [Chamaesiphon sp. VAR_48_metabat_135_sub]